MQKKQSSKWHIANWVKLAIILMIWDIIAIHLSYFLALYMRFDFHYSGIPGNYLQLYIRTVTVYSVAAVILFWCGKLYRSVWHYASVSELIRSVIFSLGASLLYFAAVKLFGPSMTRSYHFFGAIIQMMLVVGARFAPRLFRIVASHIRARNENRERVMVVGAGSAGQMLVRDMKRTDKLHVEAVCMIDDDVNKHGRYIEGIPIVGGRDDILSAVERYRIDRIYLAMPSAPLEARRDILNICSETGCKLMQLPGMYQLAMGQVAVRDMKDVSVEDLLGREPIRADLREVFDFINGKVVLVTGGGGSIGSELCRQIASHSPKQLIIFDVYENNAYAIQLELREKFPRLNLEVLIGSVRDSRRMLHVFHTYHPQIVYHAAAHKHVPLMEDSPCEAIKNNAIGTYKTAYAAMLCGCERFVLVSTDKAVNPTNIMGASKRICEMIIQCFDAKIKAGRADELPMLFTHADDAEDVRRDLAEVLRNAKTEFVAVRFGNVLGSNGSVIPIFKKQIEKGGPVTVTHPDIIRYFMTIPEAVSLVMLAGTYARGGEIFVLDMGSPVKIADLARNLIRLSGFKPDQDIKIDYTGLRPGEKLYEEKLMSEEGLRMTENEKIHIGCPIPFDEDRFLDGLYELMEIAYANREEDLIEFVEGMVSTFHPVGRKPEGIKDETFARLVHAGDQ